MIRDYDPARDAAGLRACMVELQDHERALDPAMPNSEAIADAYLERMLARAEAHARAVGVARLGIGVMASNRTARAWYARQGFAEAHVELRKPLA